MNKPRILLFALLLASIAACVTINIYFPAAAAEKAADQIIRDIQKSAPEPQSFLTLPIRFRLEGWLFWISPAYAQADLNIDSAEIRTLKASMQRRFPKLKQYLDNGWVGYANDGRVAVVRPDQIPLQERAAVEQLVAAENRDRQALYAAIAKANGHPEWTEEIRATFARRWIANAESGWLVQSPDGRWQRQP
nr:hypothetical conserved protein [uncultured Gammaproteobacteria bacterium]